MKIFGKVSSLVLSMVFTFGLTSSVMAATAINLGTAANFAVLAGSAISDAVTTSVISGNVGLSPTGGTAITGLSCSEVTGTIYDTNAGYTGGFNSNTTCLITNSSLLSTAQIDLGNAYTAAATATPATTITGDLSTFMGGVLTPGIYNSGSSIGLTGTTTLDGQGDPNAVFIFQAGSSLTTASGSHVVLINGAQACNVFWQIGSFATLGTNSFFKGNILAMSAITDSGGSTIEGRFLARTSAAVSLNNTHLVKATCVVPPNNPQSGNVGNPIVYPVPLIDIVKVPTPLALPAGPGSVTYNYTVSNIGPVAMSNVSVTDNKCSPVTFISGDLNGNSDLDLKEIWKYQCTTNLSQTTTNTVTATGKANGFTAIDTANSTVVVKAPIVPPLIHLVKKPNIFLLPAGGGAVTYTYTVTNPGTAPLSNVSVTDNKCTGLPGLALGNPGDLNHNNLLESNETWTFTCQTNITQTITNTGIAEGSANGLTAIDYSLVTVAVNAPALPNTGIAPDNSWYIALLAAISVLSLSFYFTRRGKA